MDISIPMQDALIWSGGMFIAMTLYTVIVNLMFGKLEKTKINPLKNPRRTSKWNRSIYQTTY
jgi:hypothetical protein